MLKTNFIGIRKWRNVAIILLKVSWHWITFIIPWLHKPSSKYFFKATTLIWITYQVKFYLLFNIQLIYPFPYGDSFLPREFYLLFFSVFIWHFAHISVEDLDHNWLFTCLVSYEAHPTGYKPCFTHPYVPSFSKKKKIAWHKADGSV